MGDDHVMRILIEQMAHNKGIGGQLVQGVKKCAEQWGKGAEELALHVKGMETTAHRSPRTTFLGSGLRHFEPRGLPHARLWQL